MVALGWSVARDLLKALAEAKAVGPVLLVEHRTGVHISGAAAGWHQIVAPMNRNSTPVSLTPPPACG
jgi:hypothetical protein